MMKNLFLIVMRYSKDEPNKEFYVLSDTLNNAMLKVGHYGGSITSIKMIASEDPETYVNVLKLVT